MTVVAVAIAVLAFLVSIGDRNYNEGQRVSIGMNRLEVGQSVVFVFDKFVSGEEIRVSFLCGSAKGGRVAERVVEVGRKSASGWSNVGRRFGGGARYDAYCIDDSNEGITSVMNKEGAVLERIIVRKVEFISDDEQGTKLDAYGSVPSTSSK